MLCDINGMLSAGTGGSCGGTILYVFACSDGSDLRRGSVTPVCLGSVDSEGFILGGCVFRMVLGDDCLMLGGWRVCE